MPVLSGFGALADLPWERITDKIERRVLAGRQGMVVWWRMKAGAHAAVHQHPHEQIVWMLSGKMDFRIGNEFFQRTPTSSTSSRHRAKIS